MDDDEELFDHVVRPWTVGELRAALTGLPDDLPLEVTVAEEAGGDMVGIQVVIGAGFGISQWTDERGEQIDRTFTIECEYPTGQYYRRRKNT